MGEPKIEVADGTRLWANEGDLICHGHKVPFVIPKRYVPALRAALRSDSPVKEPDREHDYRFPDEIVVEAGGSWWGGADKVYAAEYETARYMRILPASTGGERDEHGMNDWRPAWRVVEQAEDGTVTVVELDGEMYQRLPRPQVGDPNEETP